MSNQETTLSRPVNPTLDTILGRKFPVLDDGFVRVVDYMGTDDSIVQAARVSYGAGTRQVSEDRGLIRYLLRHRHSTPFEMCELKLHIRVPMDCWRQWIRHRTASVNEYSTRYSVAIDACQTTAPEEWRSQSDLNKQGSGAALSPALGAALSEEEAQFHRRARELYASRLEKGVAREKARKDLPLSTYTEAYWKIDLHNLLHFLALRMDAHAQYEIREYARLIGEEIVSRWVPKTWEAFIDYRLNGLNLSDPEVRLLALLNQEGPESVRRALREMGWLQEQGGALKEGREATDFRAKLQRLGLDRPW